jgi:hypothetical protein
MKQISLFLLSLILILPASAEGNTSQKELLSAELALPAVSIETLLYSDICHGPGLAEATRRLGLTLSTEKLELLDKEAVMRGANTRLLLTLAAMEPGVEDLSGSDWEYWLHHKISVIKEGLGPYEYASPPSLVFEGGQTVVQLSSATSRGTWALLRLFAQDHTYQVTVNLTSELADRYQEAFGEIGFSDAAPMDVTPFLIHPFTVNLSGRGYFDHRYPLWTMVWILTRRWSTTLGVSIRCRTTATMATISGYHLARPL